MTHELFGFERGRLPIVLQTETAECGLACLAMVASYHGLRNNLASLRTRLSVSLKGMNLAQLIESAQMLGFSGRPVRLELEELGQLHTPCVLHWNFNHFVVLKSVRGKRLTIHDPASGAKTLMMSEASAQFTGVALELSPTPNFAAKEELQRVSLRDLSARYMCNGWWTMHSCPLIATS